MRLKTLRKERPIFEIEGAIINGSRMGLSNNDLKPSKHRNNTAFALPTSLNSESASLIISPSEQTLEMNTRHRQPLVIPVATQSTDLPPYQAIEAAYLEHGIRIRLSPTKVTTNGQQSGRKSVNSVQRHTAFSNRNPSRTSSVLHYATTTQDRNHDSRSFSALQQTSSNDFELNDVHNVSYNLPSQVNEETNEDYYAPSIVIVNEQSNPITPREKLLTINDTISTNTLYDNDPDLAYMSSLLKKQSGDSFRDTIRRRAGLRGTFAVHRHQPTSNCNQQQSREKSPVNNRNSVMRNTTISILPTSSPKKIDKDILKHASRIRKNQLRDSSTKSLRIDATPSIPSSPTRLNKQNSVHKSLKSISLEPLELVLRSAPRSASLLSRELPSINTRNRKTSVKRTKSAKVPIFENQNSSSFLLREYSNSSSILGDESLSLMKTSPLDMVRHSNSFDSGCYDRSSSSGDIQSLISSSIIQIPSSIPSARLTSSTTRRSNTNKKVSFYEEPTTVILTTATYV